ncbi:MAG: zf-TFIIB domain-containing protein [Proteobacteria bacterium]|nr:zf-TFIIB domain-containing protein [Pseudomonadota bacterium]
MLCPRDGEKLEVRMVEGVEIDACPKCEGTFLEPGELEAIEDAHHKHATGEPPEQPDIVESALDMARQTRRAGAICPKCQLQMTPREYAYTSQIVVDRCGGCGGAWLDVGELELIEDFFDRERAENGPTMLARLLQRMGLRQ